MHISSKDNYPILENIISDKVQTQLPQQSLFADSSIQHIGQNADGSKSCWESFKDCIKLIFDQIVALFCSICPKDDQISEDGQYTMHGYEKLKKYGGLNRLELNSGDFRRIYPSNSDYPIIVPRLDFVQSTHYSKEELEWIKVLITDCIGIERRPPWDSYEDAFLTKHIYAYANLIMGMNEEDRNTIVEGIIEHVKSRTALRSSEIGNFGMDFLKTLREHAIREQANQKFNEFYRLVYFPLDEYISANVQTY